MRFREISVRSLVSCAIGAAVLLLTACATSVPSSESDQPLAGALSTAALTSDFSRSKLIAADFVSTMTQLPESSPATTVLHTNKPSSRFGELLLSALQGAGFDLRIGDAQSQFWLAYNAKREDTPSDAGNPIYTFIISAGDIKLKRSYEVDQYGVRPAGSMFVRGATTDNVAMDNSIFSVRTATKTIKPAPMEQVDEESVQLSAVPAPAALVKTPNEQVAAVAPVEAPEPASSTMLAKNELSEAVATLDNKKASDPYSDVPNMYDSRESRYKEIFAAYDVLDSAVLIFPNDSLLLGKQNKLLVRKAVKNFNSETDVMSVIGCSHGASDIVNGNAYLANNRAFRVKEEFVLAGLNPDNVLEEGCWANVEFGKMPARGVLVEHKRLKN